MNGDVEGEAEKENQEDIDLTTHERERALILGAPKTDIDSYFDQTKPHIYTLNQKPAKGNRVHKDNHGPMGKVEEAYRGTY